jgi:hypothetical protein
MNCENFEDLILDDLDRRLPPQHKTGLVNHLAGCASCRAFLSTQVELDRDLTRQPWPEPSALYEARLMRIREPQRVTSRLHLELSLNCAGVLAVAFAGAAATWQLVPQIVPGLPWAVAALLVAAGLVVVSEHGSASSS